VIQSTDSHRLLFKRSDIWMGLEEKETYKQFKLDIGRELLRLRI
jgi:hypothetical protein